MSDTNQKRRNSQSWIGAIDPSLQSRLMLPITRPGMIDHGLTNSVTDRIENMTSGLQLAADITQRWQAREDTLGKPQPIVFAKPAQTQTSSDIEPLPKSIATAPKSVVQAKRVAPASKAEPGRSSVVISNDSLVTVHDKKGSIVVQAKKTVPATNIPLMGDMQGKSTIEPENQSSQKSIPVQTITTGPMKNNNPNVQHDPVVQRKIKQTEIESNPAGKIPPSLPDSQHSVQRKVEAQTISPEPSIEKHTNPSSKPLVKPLSSESKVIQTSAIQPQVNTEHQEPQVKTEIPVKSTPVAQKSDKESAPLRVQPKHSSVKKSGVIQRSATPPLVTEIRKNNWPQQYIAAMPSTNGFNSSNLKPNTDTAKATPLAKPTMAGNTKSPSSQPAVVQRMPIKSALKTNGPLTRNVIQRTKPDSGGSAEAVDVKKIAEEVESKLMEKLNKPADADEMLEKVQRNFMRKLAIENERRGWRR